MSALVTAEIRLDVTQGGLHCTILTAFVPRKVSARAVSDRRADPTTSVCNQKCKYYFSSTGFAMIFRGRSVVVGQSGYVFLPGTMLVPDAAIGLVTDSVPSAG